MAVFSAVTHKFAASLAGPVAFILSSLDLELTHGCTLSVQDDGVQEAEKRSREGGCKLTKKILVLVLAVLAMIGQAAFAVGPEEGTEMKIKITAGGRTLTATLEDNPTSRALMEKLPLTLPMMDLYGREMCYHFAEPLPTGMLTSKGYAVGDLAYWPPRHSLVILYRQNGEHFERQHMGHIDSGVGLFEGIGDTEVLFETAE